MLVDEGFGVFGEWHDLTIQGKGGPKTGRSNVWLFPGMHKRLFNRDESPVSGTDTHTGRSKQLSPEGVTPANTKSKPAQSHHTYVLWVRAPEYKRIALVENGVVVIPAIEACDGEALPGMVRCVLLSLS